MSGVSLYIEGSKIDLSDKEGINIKLNTQDINDISKVNAGYSKDFSVQATPSNNKFLSTITTQISQGVLMLEPRKKQPFI